MFYRCLICLFKKFVKPPIHQSSGYHRATNRELSRACASKEIHLKQYTRHKEALARCTAFRDAHGDLGAAVIRFEWRSWKRLLQTSEQHPWRSVLLPDTAVMRRVYREDARAEEDFSLICSREAIVRPVELQLGLVSGPP